MKREVTFWMFAALCAAPIAACEGEPPLTPADILPPVAGASAEPTAEEATSAAPTASAARPPAPPAGSSSAEAASSAAPAASTAPPAAAATHDITGVVAATPVSLANFAVVWLEDGPPDTAPPKGGQVENRQMQFAPFVQVAAVGGKVVFANGDPFPHNVFSPDNERFNLGNIAQHGAAVRTFKKAAQYSLLCNLHPGMLGYLVVTPSNWFAKASKGGAFTIKDVPAGTYKVTAWAPRQAAVTQSVTVGAADATVRFELHRQ